MSSVSGGNMPTGGAPSSGIQMGSLGGQMPEGSGSFYMGDDGQQQEQQDEKNPELVFVDQAEVDQRSQNRQYLEGLITGKESFWEDPWTLQPELNMRSRGRRDLGKGSSSVDRRQFLVNA
ncbi:MAG: hypothetical protein QNJ31_07855 [Candidatus Caenarcaniphilales bacterium]|nr:hypothetical protein [Candidatus Caenarcaniphilales bacterium]